MVSFSAERILPIFVSIRMSHIESEVIMALSSARGPLRRKGDLRREQ